MNIYRISQSQATGYDTYNAAIVAAETEEDARKIHPEDYPGRKKDSVWGSGAWAGSPENVEVELIGKAAKGTEAGVILASFNAG